ncbi:hypothetical protein LUW75_04580 [Streptomyces sp. MRC013]|uniref:hypothetical protein n=1 Tax=Streptomyces sp. MRC013 TaxID=2898276 RepID=UPI002026475F|nr:hypothetical protein [Streptomyces sp. MRC013]URM89402.1 hypothetical protein LUW75_04580 [Streptomyces sp. MRC013]
MSLKNFFPDMTPAMSAACLAFVSLALASCSSPDAREYEIPETLCGANIPKDLLGSILPNGKEISKKEKVGMGSKFCYLSVDGKEAFAAAVEWRAEGTPLTDVAKGMHGIDPSDKITPDRRYIYSATGAAGLVECADPSLIDKDVKGDLFTWIYAAGATKGEGDIKSLIKAYTEAMATSDACRNKIW